MDNDDLLQDDLADDFDDESVDDTDEEPFDEDADADADESEDEDEQKPAKKSADKTEKRVRDLQSRLDKALAELNQVKKKAPSKDGGAEDRARDPEVEQWLNAAKDVTRTRIFAGVRHERHHWGLT
jgi:molecular chaperone GrpE (heat shock protein)